MKDKNAKKEELILLPISEYVGVDRDDPIRFYRNTITGRLYRERVELCLQHCRGGDKVLEVGFGAGATFFNLAKKYREIHGVDLNANIDDITGLYSSKGMDVYLKQGDVLHLPYTDEHFDTVLLISILEHLQPQDLTRAFQEIWRVIKPGGQMVYGVPVDSLITRLGFLLLGYDIRKHHFSTEQQILQCAQAQFGNSAVSTLRMPILGERVYEVGEFTK